MLRRRLRPRGPPQPPWLTALVALAVLWPVLLLVAFGLYSAWELTLWALHRAPSPLATMPKIFDSAWGHVLLSVALGSTLYFWAVAFAACAVWNRKRGGKPPRRPS